LLVQIAVSVPPSAAQAAKLSAARAAKRAARSAPPAVNNASVTLQKRSLSRLFQQQQDDEDASVNVKRPQRWYMGQYGEADGRTMPSGFGRRRQNHYILPL